MFVIDSLGMLLTPTDVNQFDSPNIQKTAKLLATVLAANQRALANCIG
jgi:hypothetical protein